MSRYFSWQLLKRSLVLGLPVMIGQLSHIGMNVCDTIMVGHYGSQTLAAVGVACSLWWPVAVFAVGCLQGLPGLASQLAGAKNPGEAVRLLWHGLLMAVLLGLFLDCVLWGMTCRLDLLGVPADLRPEARGYLLGLLPGLPALLLMNAMRPVVEGFGHTRPDMVIGFCGLALNIPANLAFLYGFFGVPPMGAMGTGLASSLCWVMMAAAMAGYIHFARPFQGSSFIFHPSEAAGKTQEQPGMPETGRVFPDGRLLWRLCRIGFPVALGMCLEITMFALSAVLLSPAGSTAVAAHQVTMSWSNIIFAIPLAISSVATILVGQSIGARKRLQARQAVGTEALLGVLGLLVIVGVTIGFREPIIRWFSTDPAVIEGATLLMFWCAAYQTMDFIQTICMGILRGCNDTRIISIVAVFTYGCVGLPVGYVLAMTDWLVPAMSAAGFWAGYCIALAISATVYTLRVFWLHRISGERLRAIVRK